MRLREPSSVSFSLTMPVFLPLAGSDWKQEAAGGRGFWEAAAGAGGTAAPPAGQADGAGAADMEGEGRVSLQTLWGSGPAGSPGQGTGGEVSAASKWASASERHPTSSWDRRGSPQEGGLEDAGERQEREAEMTCDERDWLEVTEMKSRKGWMTFPCHTRWSWQQALESDGLGLQCQLCQLCDTGKSHNLSKHGEIIVPPSRGCSKGHKKFLSGKMLTIVPGSLKGLRKTVPVVIITILSCFISSGC